MSWISIQPKAPKRIASRKLPGLLKDQAEEIDLILFIDLILYVL